MYYNETEARKMVAEAGLRLLEKGLVARTWGNISARISEDSFVITPSGKSYESLTADDMVKVNISDCSWEGDVKPSSEKGVHADAYALRPDVNFIIHTHQYYASAVAAECRRTSFAPCAAYGAPGSDKLRNNMAECIRVHSQDRVFLMARHGALILGGDPDEAFELAANLEEDCRTLVDSRHPNHDASPAESFDTSAVSIDELPYVFVASDPFIMECCNAGKRVPAYIDDFAQIVGPDIKVADNDPWAVQRILLGYNTNPAARDMKIPMTGVLDRMGGQHPALNSLIGRNAVLVRGAGAVCAGRTEGDAEAIAMITSKNCAAACYVKHAKPLGPIDSRLQRYIYLSKYSKQIDE